MIRKYLSQFFNVTSMGCGPLHGLASWYETHNCFSVFLFCCKMPVLKTCFSKCEACWSSICGFVDLYKCKSHYKSNTLTNSPWVVCLIMQARISIGHVNEYPTMHHFGNPWNTQSMIAYMILAEYFWKFWWKIVGLFLICPFWIITSSRSRCTLYGSSFSSKVSHYSFVQSKDTFLANLDSCSWL